jgi:hypothetical protein
MSMTCSECNEVLEMIQHITEGCPLPTKSLPPTKHKFNDSDLPYYKYIPANVLESVNYILYYNRTILMTVANNCPDITFTDKVTNTTYVMDTAVPETLNLQKMVTSTMISQLK